MPDTDSSAPDPLDQLFAASDVAPVVRSSPLATPITLSELEAGENPAGPDGPAKKPHRMLTEDLLIKLTPIVWVTPALLIANVAYFIAMVTQGVSPLLPEISEMLNWGANYAPLTWNGQPWRLLTSMFMHFGLVHLGVNMWALWTAGRFLERLVGNVGFLIIYLTSGIVGGLASLWWNGDGISAGASGAVFGLLGAFASFIWNRSDSIPLAALSRLKNSLVTCIGFNLLLGFTIPVIDQAAHVGGLLSGLILGGVLSQRLDQFTGQRRFRRNAIAAGISMLSLGILFVQHAPPPPDLFKELSIYKETVPPAIVRFNEAAVAFDAKKMTPRKLIDLLEKEILPAWRQVGEHLDQLTAIPHRRRELLHQLRTQLTLREEAWILLIEALRAKSNAEANEKLDLFKTKTKQADQIEAQLQESLSIFFDSAN